METRRYNLSYLKEISGGDEEFIMDMIQTFVADAPGEILKLKNLAESNNWAVLGENAHKFAPGLQFLGIVSLRPVINQIEDFSFGKKNLDLIPAMINKLQTECLLAIDELKNDFKLSN